MTNAEICEAVRELPDDAQFYLEREFPTIGKTIQGYGNDNTVLRLKRLCASYSRLLAAANRACLGLSHFKDRTEIDPRVTAQYEELKSAIEEAER